MLVSRLKTVAFGIFGAGLAYLAFHLWIDHQALHIIVQIEAARQRQFQEQGK